MKHSHLTLALPLFAAFAACAATPSAVTPEAVSAIPLAATQADEEQEATIPFEQDLLPEPISRPAAVQPKRNTDSIWSNPIFRQRFTESYLSEVEIEPPLTVNETEELQEILEYLAEDKLDKAVRELEKVTDEASSATYEFLLGNFYREQGRDDAAVHAYRRAGEKYPKFRRAFRAQGEMYARARDFEQALPALTRVLELGGGDAATYGLVGYSYANVGNYIAAESAYRQANLLDPTTIDWQMGLAESFFRQGRYAEASSLTGELIDNQPDVARFWLLQGNAYVGLGEPLEAAKNFEMVESLGASTSDSLSLLGDIYANEGIFERAVKRYTSALERGAKPTRALRAAPILIRRDALEETKTLLSAVETNVGEALSDEEKKNMLRLRASIAVREGASEEEVAILEEVVALDPMDGEAFILLGDHSRRSGNVEQAVYYYERAEGIEDTEANAKVRHAELLASQRKYDEAVQLLQQAQELDSRPHVQSFLEKVKRAAARNR